MKPMLGRSSVGGASWNQMPLQGREAGRAMASLPLFRSRYRAHLAKTAALPTPAVRLEVVGRTTGFRKAANLRGRQATSRVVLWVASSATPPPLREPASDALDEPSPSSLRAHLHLAKPVVSSVGRTALLICYASSEPPSDPLASSLNSLNDKIDRLRAKLDLLQCKLE